MWDLADMTIEAQMVPEMETLLLESYFGRHVGAEDRWRMRANKVMIDCFLSLWGKARAAFDSVEMETYASERCSRMLKHMKSIREV